MSHTVFLSYARGDDEAFVSRLYADLTSRGFDVWWDRISMPARGLTFLSEIRDAIDARERFLLVLGPQAAVSDYVIAEWQYALAFGKVINPVLRLGRFQLLPHELKPLHVEDFRDDARYKSRFNNLVRQLRAPVAPMGRLFDVPGLPPHLLPRPKRLRALKEALLAGFRRPAAAAGEPVRVGVHGMGGVGKSVLVNLLARDAEVRRAFPDGVVWVSLGTAPALPELQRNVCRTFAEAGSFQNVSQGRVKLGKLLSSRAVLLVLDDVWERTQVEAFDRLGPRCGMVVTTRDSGVIASLGGAGHEVQLLSEADSLSLLAGAAGMRSVQLPPEADNIVHECGFLPLAVALCGGMVRRGATWAGVLQRLEQAALESVADRNAAALHHRSLWAAMQVSVDALTPDEQRRFIELSVFPNHQRIPEAAVRTLWSRTGGLGPFECEDLLLGLSERSLVRVDAETPRPDRPPARRVSLHDLLYDFAARLAGDPIPNHNHLLDAYRELCPHGWPSGPNDGYFFENLPRHLLAGGRMEDAVLLLQSIPWIAAKLSAVGNVNQIIGDYSLLFSRGSARPAADAVTKLDLYRRFVARQGHRLEQRPEAVLPLALQEPVSSLVRQDALRMPDRTFYPAPFVFRRLNVPLEEPNPSLQRVLKVNGSAVAVALSDAGRFCVVCYDSGALQYWDLAAATLLRTWEGSGAAARSVQISRDGTRAVSLHADGAARVWSLPAGTVRSLPVDFAVTHLAANSVCSHVLLGGETTELALWDLQRFSMKPLKSKRGRLLALSLSDDAQSAMTANIERPMEGRLQLWDLSTGKCLAAAPWQHHGVDTFRVSADARVAIAVFDNGKAGGGVDLLVRWNLGPGNSREYNPAREYDKDKPIGPLCLSRDGHWALAGHWEKLVVWDLETGERHRVLRGSADHVRAIALGWDLKFAVSAGEHDYAADQSSLNIWDLAAEAPVHPPDEGRASAGIPVSAFAISADRKSAISAAGRILSCWDLETGRRRFARECRGKITAISIGGSTLAVSADERPERYDDPHYHSPYLSFDWPVFVRLWDLRQGTELRSHKAHDGRVTLLYINDSQTFCLSGNRWAYDDADRRVNWQSHVSLVRWRLKDGSRKPLHGSWFKRVSESDYQCAESVLAVPPGDKVLIGTRLWNLRKLSVIARLQSDDSPPAGLVPLAVSVDGRYVAARRHLAFGDLFSRTYSYHCVVWDLEAGHKTMEMQVDLPIGCLALSAHGEFLLMGSGAEVSFWHVPTAGMLAVFPCEFEVTSVALSRGAPWIACVGDKGGNQLVFDCVPTSALAHASCT